ncbi:MAG: hypothetical protein ACK4F8_01670 [Aquabacterium sp.]
MIVEIFNTSDDAQRIMDAVLLDGVAGIHGGRVAVRKRLGEVAELAESAGHRSINAYLTIDHPDTELGYPFDSTRFDRQEASKLVRTAYDAKSF